MYVWLCVYVYVCVCVCVCAWTGRECKRRTRAIDKEKDCNVYGDTKITFQLIVFQSFFLRHQFSQLGVHPCVRVCVHTYSIQQSMHLCGCAFHYSEHDSFCWYLYYCCNLQLLSAVKSYLFLYPRICVCRAMWPRELAVLRPLYTLVLQKTLLIKNSGVSSYQPNHWQIGRHTLGCIDNK